MNVLLFMSEFSMLLGLFYVSTLQVEHIVTDCVKRLPVKSNKHVPSQ